MKSKNPYNENIIKELNKKVGVSLNPETKVSVIKDYLDKIDLFQKRRVTTQISQWDGDIVS